MTNQFPLVEAHQLQPSPEEEQRMAEELRKIEEMLAALTHEDFTREGMKVDAINQRIAALLNITQPPKA